MWHFASVDLVLMYAAAVGILGWWRLSEDAAERSGIRLAMYLAALVGLGLCVSSPLDRLSMQWLTWHMVIHVVEMFYLPLLLVLSAPRVFFVSALPTPARRIGRQIRDGLRGPLSALGRPVVAVVGFSAVMVFWHIPGVFAWAMANMWSHDWLMLPSFVAVGIGFWRVIVVVPPRARVAGSRFQIVAVLGTSFVMLVLAMAMAIVAHTPWYPSYVALHGATGALRDQHYAAGVLWICGDLWAIPALVVIGTRVLSAHGGTSVAVDRFFGRSEAL